MLKVNQQNSKENLDKICRLVRKEVGDDTYTCLYAYQEKNFIIIKTLTHYALGFNDNDIIVIPMSAEGEKLDSPQVFKLAEEAKISISGIVILSNGSSKLKLQVPGMMPKIMGAKQLEVDQVTAYGEFIEKIKSGK